MLTQLSLPTHASHTDVLDRGAETGQFMSGEMGHTHQGIGIIDLMGHGDFTMEISLDGHSDTGVSQEAVSNDDGGADRRETEAVCHSGPEMGNRFGAFANIEGIGIREKGFATELLDARNNACQEDGSHIGRISRFPEMEFYGYQVVRLDEVFGRSPLHQAVDLIEQVEPRFDSQISKIHRSFHNLVLASVSQAMG